MTGSAAPDRDVTHSSAVHSKVGATIAKYRAAFSDMATSEKLMLPSQRLQELRKIQAYREAERDAKKSWYDHSRKVIKSEQTHTLDVPGLYVTHDHRDSAVARQTDLNDREHAAHASRRQECLVEASQYTKERKLFPQRRVCPSEQFNFRNIDTHSRIWPTYKPKWDAERAGELRAHEIRGRHYNPINHCSNVIPGIPQ